MEHLEYLTEPQKMHCDEVEKYVGACMRALACMCVAI